MILTLMLSAAGGALLFLGFWGVTVTTPTALLAKNFPKMYGRGSGRLAFHEVRKKK